LHNYTSISLYLSFCMGVERRKVNVKGRNVN